MLRTGFPELSLFTIAYGRRGTPMGGYFDEIGGPMNNEELYRLTRWLKEQVPVESIDLPREPVAGDARRGREIFAAQCARCHGAEGESGEGMVGPAIGNPALLALAPDAFLRYAIENGRDGTEMAGFAGILSADDMSPSRREAWIRMSTPKLDSLIVNPRLVETGLDLIMFSDLVSDAEFDAFVIRVLAVFKTEPRYVLGDEIGRRFGVPRSVVTAATIVFLAIAVFPARAGLQRVADRLTARRRAAFAEEIIAFSRRIQFLISLEDVSSFVVERMVNIVHAEQAYLFLRGETGDYALRASAPALRRTPLTSFPPGTALIGLMRQQRLPLMLEYFDRLWLKSNLDRISRELISLSQAAAAVPQPLFFSPQFISLFGPPQ